MADGWVKLHRSLLDWEWYTDLPCFRLFTHLLLTANYEPSRFQGEVVPAGGKVTGLHALSSQTGLSISQLRTALDKLGRTGEIAIKTTNKFSVITIINWVEYQTDDKRIANQSQTDSKPIATSKEGKNKRNKEYTPSFETFWAAYPKNGGTKKEAFTAWNKIPDTVDREMLTKKAVDYSKTNEPKYLKHAATWLNAEGWTAEYAPKGGGYVHNPNAIS